MIHGTFGRGGNWVPAAAVLLLASWGAEAAPSASTVYAQRSKKKSGYEAPAEVDPYTGGEPAALLEAGYVSYGPFEWADGHDTRAIEEILGLPVLWVETAHFRLGSTLWEYRVSDDRDEKRKLRAELEKLREFLPNVPKRTRDIDPWLRLHLYAMRVEQTYSQFLEDFGLEDLDFPSAPAAKRRPHPMGRGPYLGMQEKFTILLTEKASTLGRYTGHYLRVKRTPRGATTSTIRALCSSAPRGVPRGALSERHRPTLQPDLRAHPEPGRRPARVHDRVAAVVEGGTRTRLLAARRSALPGVQWHGLDRTAAQAGRELGA